MTFDPAEYRGVLGHYPTGVVVVTACDSSGEPVGMVIGSFTSVSLDPPLVAFLPAKSSHRFAKLRQSETFCVNILGHEQEAVCRQIASSSVEGLGDARWHLGSAGAPVLDEAVAWFDCSYDSITEAGDHYIVLGRVEAFGAHNPRSPLIFFQGGMGRFASSSMVVAEDVGLIEGVRLGNARVPRWSLWQRNFRRNVQPWFPSAGIWCWLPRPTTPQAPTAPCWVPGCR